MEPHHHDHSYSDGPALFPKLRARERSSAGLFSRKQSTNPRAVAQIEEIRKRAAEPLRGIIAPGGTPAGLFPLKETGVDMRPAVVAVSAYLNALTDSERSAGRFPMDDETWRHWANPAAFLVRHGLLMESLSEEKRELAFDIMRRTLSDEGFRLAVDCMHLNRTVGEIRGEVDDLNEWLYWFSVYGEPESGVWGWQLDGHHVNVNCVFVGDQMVLTPLFLGAEPAWAEAGLYAGTSVLQPEQNVAAELFNQLSAGQQSRALIADEMPPDLFTCATRDNFELSYEGLPLADLSSDQNRIATDLLDIYISRASAGHAAVKFAEVLQHLPATYLAWIGGAGPDGVFYYRLHSPVILVEFEHQAGVMFDNAEPERHHIHTMVRTPNGNDYGADLLRQHHERWHAPHSH